MTPRRRALRAYRELEVPVHVVTTAMAIWLVLGTAVALHLEPFDLPPNYHMLLGWGVGGFAGAFFYILFACE